MMAPRTARAEFSCVKQYCKLFAIVLVSAVLAGFRNGNIDLQLDRPSSRGVNALPIVAKNRRLPALSTMKDAWFWGAPWLTFNLFPILVALSSSRGDADRSLKLASLVVVRCQPWIYLRLLA